MNEKNVLIIDDDKIITDSLCEFLSLEGLQAEGTDTIKNALKKLDPEPIQKMVIKCEKAGADLIDINSGPLSRNPMEKMTFLVETIQSVFTNQLNQLLNPVNSTQNGKKASSREQHEFGNAAGSGPL